MSLTRPFTRPLLASALALLTGAFALECAGCGGKTVLLLGDTEPGTDAGTGTPDATTVVEVDGATCLDITVTNADLSCAIDDECALANTGVICTPGCGCPGGTAVNSAAATRISAEIENASLPPVTGCAGGCANPGTPRCIEGQCTLCPFDGEDAPPGCFEVEDGGTIGFDASLPPVEAGEPDAGEFDGGEFDGGDFDAGESDAGDFDGGESDAGESDGGVTTGLCVDVDLTGYDTNCVTAADCTVVFSGEVCTGECSCEGNAAISASARGEWEQAVQGITFETCHCVPSSPVCLHGQCSLAVSLPP